MNAKKLLFWKKVNAEGEINQDTHKNVFARWKLEHERRKKLAAYAKEAIGNYKKTSGQVSPEEMRKMFEALIDKRPNELAEFGKSELTQVAEEIVSYHKKSKGVISDIAVNKDGISADQMDEIEKRANEEDLVEAIEYSMKHQKLKDAFIGAKGLQAVYGERKEALQKAAIITLGAFTICEGLRILNDFVGGVLPGNLNWILDAATIGTGVLMTIVTVAYILHQRLDWKYQKMSRNLFDKLFSMETKQPELLDKLDDEPAENPSLN